MSIWSTIADIGDVWTVGYGPPGDDRSDGLGASEPLAHGVDLATAAHYGDQGIRFCVDSDECSACIVLPRAKVIELRDALTAWLDAAT